MPRAHGNLGRPSLACRRCRRRKIKCDLQTPECGNCCKAKAECLPSQHTSADSNGRRTQGQIEAMELRLAQLKNDHALVQFSPAGPGEDGVEEASSMVNDPEATLRISAPGFLEHVASDQYRTMTLTRIIKVTLLVWTEQVLPFGNTGQPLPLGITHVRAQEYLDCYRQGIHADLPFVDIESCEQKLLTVLPAQGLPNLDSITLMVMAIGALTQCTSSLERSCHIVLCANAARQNMAQMTDKESIETLQLLLLLTVFSLYDPSGGKSCYLVGLCVQVAVTLGLHQTSLATMEDPGFEPGIRALWSAYVLDRVISVALDIPCGISDDDIISPNILQNFPDCWQLERLCTIARSISKSTENSEILHTDSDLLELAAPIQNNSSRTGCRIGQLLSSHLVSWSLGPPFSSLQQPPAASHYETYIDLIGSINENGFRIPWIVAYSLVHSFLVNMLLEQMVSRKPDHQNLSILRDRTRSTVVLALVQQFPSLAPLSEVAKGLPTPHLDIANAKTLRLLTSLNVMKQPF